MKTSSNIGFHTVDGPIRQLSIRERLQQISLSRQSGELNHPLLGRITITNGRADELLSMYSEEKLIGLSSNLFMPAGESKESEEEFDYPCILYVSRSSNFKQDPYVRNNKRQVCIGKINGKYICIEQAEEDQVDWMLGYFNKAIKSGGISGLILAFWEYAIKEEKLVAIRKRLEELRTELRAERISIGELNELQSLAKYIDSSDVELLQAAGVPEFGDDETN